MVDRLRLGKSLHGPIEGAGDEYGNYRKFEDGKNQIKKVNDKGYNDAGYPVHQKNIRNMFETMANPEQDFYAKKKDEAEKDVIDSTIKNTIVDDPEMFDDFTDLKDKEIDNKLLHD